MVELQAFAAVLIQGPTACAPPVFPNRVWHESTLPTFGEVETFPSLSGSAVGSTRVATEAWAETIPTEPASPPTPLSATPQSTTARNTGTRVATHRSCC